MEEVKEEEEPKDSRISMEIMFKSNPNLLKPMMMKAHHNTLLHLVEEVTIDKAEEVAVVDVEVANTNNK